MHSQLVSMIYRDNQIKVGKDAEKADKRTCWNYLTRALTKSEPYRRFSPNIHTERVQATKNQFGFMYEIKNLFLKRF